MANIITFPLTYQQLINTLTNYLENTDEKLIQTIPLFIGLAQNRIASECKTIYLTNFLESKFTENENIVPKPSNWRSQLNWIISETDTNPPYNLEKRTLSYVQMYSDPKETGKPLFYADYGHSQWLVSPTPNKDYAFKIGYSINPQPLGEQISTNVLTQYYPELLLKACLFEATPYLKNDQRIELWKNDYNDTRTRLLMEDANSKQDGFSNPMAD